MHGFGVLRRGALLGVLGCLAAVGLALPSTAAAKVTSLTSCQTISSAGKYRLDADVTAPATCFVINAGGVTLGLNGHTVTGSGTFFGIVVFGSGAKIVGPGTVSRFGTGIGIRGDDGSVRGVTATGNASNGIAVDGSGNDVRGNVTTDNSAFGIVAGGGPTGNTIIGNYAHGNGADLADFNSNCDSNVWRGNDFGTANQSCIH
jgi:parallel beta-helix repeat protein